MKIRGDDIIVMFESDSVWHTLAYGLSCELDVTVDTINISNPFSGKFPRLKKRRINWAGSSAHLLSNQAGTIDIKQLIMSDIPVKILVGSVESDRGFRIDYHPDGRFAWQGDAFITRLTITGAKGTLSTMSMEFQGTGEPESFSLPPSEEGIFDNTFDKTFE